MIIRVITGVIFILFGISCFFRKKPVSFWSNIKPFEVDDTKGYNLAVGKMWCTFGVFMEVISIMLIGVEHNTKRSSTYNICICNRNFCIYHYYDAILYNGNRKTI